MCISCTNPVGPPLYSYGYSNPTSTKSESRTLDGIVEGTYSYISPDGRIITNNYAADHTGFR